MHKAFGQWSSPSLYLTDTCYSRPQSAVYYDKIEDGSAPQQPQNSTTLQKQEDVSEVDTFEGTSAESTDGDGNGSTHTHRDTYSQVYERAPHVDIAQILQSTLISRDNFLEAVRHEEVKIFDIAISEYSELYERVPNVDVEQLLLATRCNENPDSHLYEKVPAVNIAQILSQGSGFEQISGYERVQYRETMEQILSRVSGGRRSSVVSMGEYERVHYSEDIEQVFGRHHESRIESDCELNTYERVQYSKSVQQMLQMIPRGNYQCPDTQYERVRYGRTLEEVLSGHDCYERVHYRKEIEDLFHQ
jgi:hypothetical protein